MGVRFIEINKGNLLLASFIQLKIFKIASAFCDYTNKEKAKYYLVYAEGEPIGVTGFTPDSKIKDMAWVAWLGILPKYRGKGYGR